MKCRSCGTEIADKAIVCFRCGTPTAGPAPPVRPAGRRGGPAWMVLAIVVLIIALGVWLVPQTTGGSAVRWTVWAALAVATFAALRLLRRRR